jgi:hypothetical protein
METLSVGCVNLPAGKTISCGIGPLKSLPVRKAKLVNPSISTGGATLTFPITLESGDYLEFRAAEDCKVYNAKGDMVKAVVPEGAIPMLEAGDNELRLAAGAPQDGPRPRLRVSAITSGEPFPASAQQDQ